MAEVFTIKDISEKHGISKKNITKHCNKGRFILEDIEYIAKNIAKPNAKRAKWQIAIFEPELKNNTTANAENLELDEFKPRDIKEKHIAVKIEKDAAHKEKLEQEIKENKIRQFQEYLEIEKDAMLQAGAPVKEFIRENITDAEILEEWNLTWETFLNDVYTKLSNHIANEL
ncbi:hypothetical protein AAEX28_12465 [Lentisphaerota bacterium WC36G]|nr:hypothetical protein LJT99_15290 [Lentisphaerae bacterium WC36]